MLKRRLKRLVSLAVSLCTVALFIVRLPHGGTKHEPWSIVLTRGVGTHQPDFELSSMLPVSEATDGDIYRSEGDLDEFARVIEEYEGTESELHVKRDEGEDEDDDEDDEELLIANAVELPISEIDDGEDDQSSYLPEAKDYREIFSLTSLDRKFYSIYLGGDIAYNPSIIPHPTRHDLWIIIAQHEQGASTSQDEETLTCTAGFFNDVLVCTAPPTVLPVTKSIEGRCTGDIEYFNLRGGPRDPRTFYGPEAPYVMYGSQVSYTCMGIWLQDLRMLLQDFQLEQMTLVKLFKRTLEVQRPPPVKDVEKNFFLFWDGDNKAYAHHDIYPSRVFAQLSFDGSVGPNLAPTSEVRDGICMAKYMPILESEHEKIHQATNSLSITMCRRKDPFCVPSDSNTFIMTIFQHKSYYDFHSVYDPYVMLFQRTAPFAIHAISQRPLWIHGREQLTAATHAVAYDRNPDRKIPEGHSEMFYITSMSWKTHGQRYHGYLDDPLFLAFGIEDSRSAVIDVMAEDLLQDLGFCSH